MNLNIFVPGLESYMEDVSIVNNVNTETPAEEVKEEEVVAEEAPIAEEEVKEETEEQKEEMFTSFWK